MPSTPLPPTLDFKISMLHPPAHFPKEHNLHLSAISQPPSIPILLKDSMAIREAIFVIEQDAVPLVHHVNSEDGRSYHFVAYANSIPIGILRILPPPNDKRPLDGTIIHPHPPEKVIPSGEQLFGEMLGEEVKHLEETWEETSCSVLEWQRGILAVWKDEGGEGVEREGCSG